MRPSPSAAELAEAMREGLLTRRALGSADVVRGLRTHARIHDLPPVAKPGALRLPMLVLRRIAHVLVRPWWAAQSDFNASVLTALEEVNRELAVLRTASATPAAPPHPASPSTPGIVSRPTLVQVFAHSRLPAEPQRVLVLGDADQTFARSLLALGIDATSLPAPATPSPPDGGQLPALPPPSASVDHVVDLQGQACGFIAEIVRVLKPGGSVIGSLTLDPGPSGGSGAAEDATLRLRQRLAPLRPSEVVLAVEDRGSWRVVVGGPNGSGALPSPATDLMVLFVAERP